MWFCLAIPVLGVLTVVGWYVERFWRRRYIAKLVTGSPDVAALRAFYASVDPAYEYMPVDVQKHRFAQWLAHGEMSDKVRHCLECGYSLIGLVSDACPECGWQIPPAFLDVLRKQKPTRDGE